MILELPECQHCILRMSKYWKSALDKNESGCALFVDLSEVFDHVNHDLLLAKLKASGTVIRKKTGLQCFNGLNTLMHFSGMRFTSCLILFRRAIACDF